MATLHRGIGAHIGESNHDVSLEYVLAIVKTFVSRSGALSESLVHLFASLFSRRSADLRPAQHRLSLSDDERLALLGDSGFWSLDPTSGEVWANQEARSAFGLEQNARLQRAKFLACIHEDDRAELLAAIGTPLDSSEAREIELRVVGANHAMHWVTVKVCMSCSGQNAPARVTGYVVDQRQHKRAGSELFTLQQKLTHLTRIALLGELSGALAHELQQPLTAILSNAQAALLLVDKNPEATEELKEILGEIVSDDKHAGQIITSLRALLIRAETEFQRVDMQRLVEEVLILSRGTLMERNVQVHTRVDEGMSAVHGNGVELKQVLLNLVLNACDAMILNPARDRQMEIVVSHKEDLVRVSVLDCGMGIDAEQMQQLFEPFFTTKKNGLGLGLAISRSIVGAHGGRLWASNRPDRGAAFHFTLPLADQVSESPPGPRL